MIRFLYHGGTLPARNTIVSLIRQELAAGRKAVLLVPEQESADVERRMLEELPPAAQLSFEVLNFSRLANRTFRVLGGLSYRAATPPVAALMMWRTLVALSGDLLLYGKDAACSSAFCDKMLATHAQMKAYGISPEILLETAKKLSPEEPLAKKLTDIATVLSAFESDLSVRYDDASDDLSRLFDLLSGKEGQALFSETSVFVDSFTDFTKQELNILNALMRAAPDFTVSFPLSSPEERGVHLSLPLATHRKLKRMAEELDIPIKIAYPTEVEEETAVTYLAKNLFSPDAAPMTDALTKSGAVRLCRATSPFEEATHAVSVIHRLVREGAHYRDIAIVVRSADKWRGILDAALEREGIPFFLSEKTDVSVRPLMKMILEIFFIKLYDWRTEDVIEYVKTGLCGVTEDDADVFEEYLSVWKPRGARAFAAPFTKNPDGYTDTLSTRGKNILDIANRVRETLTAKLSPFFAALDKAPNARACCQALAKLLDTLHIPDTLQNEAKAALAAGERREAEELSRLYGVVLDALEGIADAIGDDVLSPEEFYRAITIVFSRTDIGSIPTAADEVTLGEASMMRAGHPRFVLILGLNEGEFPKNVRDDGLIDGMEKERLEDLGLSLPQNEADLSSAEFFYVFRAFSSPREALFLSSSDFSATGAALAPSIAFERAKFLLGMEETPRFDTANPRSYVYTPQGALEHFDAFRAADADKLRALLEERGVAAAKMLTRPAVQKHDEISKDAAERLFKERAISPTQLEKFAGCRFAYYCQYVLRLREEADDAFDSSAVGTVVHAVLERFFRRLLEKGIPFGECDKKMRRELIGKLSQEYLADLTEKGYTPSPRTLALYTRAEMMADVAAASVLEELKNGDFSPVALEYVLKDAALKNGNTTVTLAGKIDRVDLWKDPSGRVFVRVVDYKTGDITFSSEALQEGFSMQMPLYLFSLCRTKNAELCRLAGLPEDTEFLPAAVTYLSAKVSSEQTLGSKDPEAALDDAVARIKRSGVLLGDDAVYTALNKGKAKNGCEIWNARDFADMFDTLEKSVSRIYDDMKSGAATAEPHAHGKELPCQYCSFKAICRLAIPARR